MARSPGIKYFSIGKIVTTHGLKGEVVLKHVLGKTRLEELKTFFIKEKEGSFLPWFPENIRNKNTQEVYVKLEGIDTPETARQLIQKEVWLSDIDFKKFASQSAPISLLGYTIIDGTTELGRIDEIIEQPHQVLCRLEIRGREVFIPLHKESLKKIDPNKKTVTVTLPDGLLDIYLS